MADTLVILGGVVFTDFAVPDKINFGGKQTLAIHKAIGGQRTINPTGADPDPITWSGKFRGPGALGSAQAVDAMRIAGLPVSLSWLGLSYSVIVSQFKGETEKYYEVPYTVTCEVVTDPNQLAGGAPASLTSLVGADLSSIMAIPLASALPSVAALNALVGPTVSLDGAVSTVIGPVISAASTVQTAIASAISSDDAIVTLGAASGCAGVVAGFGTAINSATNLQASIAAMASQSTMQNAYALVTRIGTNLTTGGI